MKGKRWCFGAALLLIALALLFRFGFVVRRIDLPAEYGPDADRIIAASGIEMGASLFLLDEAEIRAGINALGTYAFQGVELRLPWTAKLQIQRREPAAMLLCGEKLAVLDAGAVVIEFAEEAPDRDLIYVSGVKLGEARPGEQIPLDEARLRTLRDLLEAIEHCGAAAYVSEIELSAAEEAQIITPSGMLVKLGALQDLPGKIACMSAAVQDICSREAGDGVLNIVSANCADYRKGT